jgi:hypothetical protein
MTKEHVQSIIQTYGQAWEQQDSSLILTIFNDNATYQEGPFAIPMQGHKEIKSYWDKKVVQEQREIKFTLLNILLDGDTAAVEWNGDFIDVITNERVHMYEVAIINFVNNKISSLRETWKSQRSKIAL